jgi:hypothetical protein
LRSSNAKLEGETQSWPNIRKEKQITKNKKRPREISKTIKHVFRIIICWQNLPRKERKDKLKQKNKQDENVCIFVFYLIEKILTAYSDAET